MSNRVASAIFWASASRVSTQLLTWITTILVMRNLSPGDYGITTIAFGLYGLVAVIVDWSLMQILIRMRTPSIMKEREVLGLACTCIVLAALVLLGASGILKWAFGAHEFSLALLIIAAAVVILPIKLVPESRWAREQQFRFQNLALVIELLVSCFSSLGLSFILKDYRALLFGFLIGLAVRVAYVVAFGSFIRPVIGKSSLASGFTELRLVASSEATRQLSTIIPNYMIGAGLGAQVLGLFSTGQHIVTMPSSRIMSVLNQILLPYFSAIKEGSPVIQQSVLKACQLLLWFCLPIFVGLASVSADFVSVLLGSKWTGLSGVLVVLALCMPLRLLSDFLVNPLRALRLDAEILRLSGVFLGVQIACAVFAFFVSLDFLVWIFGLGWILAAGYGISVALSGLKVSRLEFAKSAIVPSLAVALMATICLWLVQGPLAGKAPIVRLGASVAVSAIVYLIIAGINFRGELIQRFGRKSK